MGTSVVWSIVTVPKIVTSLLNTDGFLSSVAFQSGISLSHSNISPFNLKIYTMFPVTYFYSHCLLSLVFT